MNLQQILKFPQTVKLYLLSCVFFGVGTGIYELVYNLHLLNIGINSNDIGTLYLINFIVMSITSVPSGLLADRYGRRWFLVGGSFLFGITMLLIPWFTNLYILGFLQALNALGGIIMFTTESSTIAGEVSEEKRTQLFSFIYVNYLFWDGVGTLLGGQLPYLLTSRYFSQYQLTLFISGIFCTLIGVIRYFIKFKDESTGGKEKLTNIFPKAPMIKIAILAFFIGGSATLAMRFINIILQSHWGFDTSMMSYLIFIEKIVSFIGAALAPIAANYFSNERAGSYAMFLSVPLMICAGITNQPMVFMFLYLCRQGVHYFQMPYLDNLSVSTVSYKDRSAMSSYREIGFYLGSAILAKVYGSLLERENFVEAFILSGLLALLAGFVYLRFVSSKSSV
ncbi:MFS transporter [Nostoc parmelioides]|jgi:MFS transporter, DHA1 family, multidrug resistance protein|uniref:MFS transporter n=1 Tax=Nostoc parmelioides FACHB-3921 TaxID=2692909 RepID=A0ABR8BPD7_9NOSO|nr:MFS transporter [Nostoc parmelioides]MBD2255549.1 MFS transporter [Nostoc parmelioides FACHB-3921]